MELTPVTVQNMPDCLSLWRTTVLQPASISPEPTKRCCFGSSRPRSSVRGQAIEFPLTVGGLLLDHGHAGAVHLDIESGNGLAHNHGQVELHGPFDVLLFTPRDFLLDGVRRFFPAHSALVLLPAAGGKSS